MDMRLYHLGPLSELKDIMFSQSGLTGFPNMTFEWAECGALSSRWWLVNSREKLKCASDIVWPQRLEQSKLKLMADREAPKFRSAYIRRPIPLEGLREITVLLESPGSHWRLFQWKAYGGAFEDVATSFNAFPYRSGVLMHTEYGTSFGYGNPRDMVPESAGGDAFEAATWAWYKQARAVMAKYETGELYNGYVSLDDDVAKYFGPNYGRLRAVKKKYDPGNVFNNLMSVPPAK
jgi:FAD/FMN-containing dehydrogenase